MHNNITIEITRFGIKLDLEKNSNCVRETWAETCHIEL